MTVSPAIRPLGTLRAYGAFFGARFRTLFQYRTAAFAGFVTQVFWGFIKIMIMDAFFRSGVGDQPMELGQVITYIWLGQALLGMMPWNADREIEEMIRRGNVAYELLRPLDLYWAWFCRALALRTATTSLRATFLVLFAGVLMPLLGYHRWAFRLPATPVTALLYLVSLAAALLLSGAITTLFSITMTRIISGRGINILVSNFVMIFSGMIVPLPLFPAWSRPILKILPFRGVMDVPSRIYTGHIPLGAIPAEIGLQLAWGVALILVGRLLISGGIRKLTVHGG